MGQNRRLANMKRALFLMKGAQIVCVCYLKKRNKNKTLKSLDLRFLAWDFLYP